MPGAGVAAASGELLIIGLSHRTSPLGWRERFAEVEARLPLLLGELGRRGSAEAVLLATCDRVELVTGPVAPAPMAAVFAGLIAPPMGLAPTAVEAALQIAAGTAALRHLAAVASALDGQIIGEPHVLGQVKDAHRRARDSGLVGSVLGPAFRTAFAAARRIRRETRIAEGPVSMAAAAIQLARDVHGALDRSTALLLGPSEMGELMGEQLRRAGLARLVICGPPSQAERAARRLAANVVPLEGLDDALGDADIIVAALGNGQRLVTAPAIAVALRRRRQRPVFVIDAAIPADVDPRVNELEGAFLYDLDDLERAAMAGRATREAAATAAWAIVEEELAAHERRTAERAAVPVLVALRRHFEQVRREVLAETPGLDAEAVTRRLVSRLLHDPSAVLREEAADTPAMVALLRRLFGLEDAAAPDPVPDHVPDHVPAESGDSLRQPERERKA